MRFPAHVRRRLGVLTALVVCTALAAPTAGAAGKSARELQQDKSRIDAALDESSHELEHASAAVRNAAAALARVQAQLPIAQEEVAEARGALAAAQARDAAAAAALIAAEAAAAAAERKAAEAGADVVAGREQLGDRARAVYQRGPLANIETALEADSPTELMERSTLLKTVLDHNTALVNDLADARARLASERADLRAARAEVSAKRAAAATALKRTAAAEQRAVEARVALGALIEERYAARKVAERERAKEAAEYAVLQRSSQWLSRKIREAEAAAQRAAAERARRAAAARAKARRNAPRAQSAAPEEVRSARFTWPTNGQLTSRYGYRYHPIYKVRRFHAGIDIGAPYGTAIWAGDGGVVIYAGYAQGYGQLVVIAHGDGLATAYGHMSSINVSDGEYVDRGEKIAEVGSLGASTGPHLHFEVRRDGEPVNPMNYL